VERTVKLVVLVSMCGALFAGCAQLHAQLNTMPDRGRDYNPADVKKLTVGQSSEEDVVRLFGPPLNRTSRSDGSVQLMYMFSKAHPSAVDLFGNNPGYYVTKSMIINLGSDGKLKDYTQTGR
jgi:outer membrane protein assembly factor BamE (lipoprotein component of BamABCDE complex)